MASITSWCTWTALLILACHHAAVDGLITIATRGGLRPRTQKIRSTSLRSQSTPTSTEVAQHSYASPTFDSVQDDKAMVMKYLERIGLAPNRADGLINQGKQQQLNLDDLQHLLTAHLFTVPFENLDQHTHPADDVDYQYHPSETRAKEIPRQPSDQLPSLDVRKSLHKICLGNRGGFCYELNLSFAWLLRSLGFNARLAVADVSCSQSIPGHVVILVDELIHGSSVLVDVGFGTPGVCDVVLPLVIDKPYLDTHGDSFRFDSFSPSLDGTDDPFKDRFDTVLYRTRVANPEEEEPMYRFHSLDNLPDNCEEFSLGLHHVLNHSPTFTGKRLCVVSTDRGHCTLGEGYVKWVEKGETVKTVEFQSETEWRQALVEHFGVVL